MAETYTDDVREVGRGGVKKQVHGGATTHQSRAALSDKCRQDVGVGNMGVS